MTYETTIQKSYDGKWRGLSTTFLGDTQEGKRILELSTSKKSTGIASNANVFIHKPDGSKMTEIFGDFTKYNISQTNGKRATETAIRSVHELALLQMDDLVIEAKAFYVEKDNQPT